MSNDNTQDTLSAYGETFQNKVVSALTHNIQLIDGLYEVIDPMFFDMEANRWVVTKLKEYYKEYKKLPTLDVFKVEVSKLESPTFSKLIVDQLRVLYVETDTEDIEYVSKEFKDFCKNRAIKNAILKSVDLLKAGRYTDIQSIIDSALNIDVDTLMGHDYLAEFERRSMGETRTPIPTGLTVIDELTQGGLSGGELGVVVAPSGAGKCVGKHTEIDIQYDEIGFEVCNGHILWYAPWEKIKLDDITLYAWQVEHIVLRSIAVE